MLRKGTALAVMLALSLVLAACGGSSEEAGGAAPATPAPTQTASATPEVESTPVQTATPTPDVESTPTEVASEETATAEPASAEVFDLAEHLRDKTMQLWDVYNTYDVDGLKVFYEENYWNEQEEELRSNMRPFKSYGATITAEETSPPTEISPGKWEIKQDASFTGGSIKMVFIYEEFDGKWLLTHAENE